MKKVVCFILSCFFASIAFGQESLKTIILNDKQETYLIEPYLEVLPDSLGILTIEQASSLEYASRFQKEYNNLAWLANQKYKAHWVRFIIENIDSEKEWLLGINGSSIKLFDLQSDNTYKKYQTGYSTPKSLRFFGSTFSAYTYLPLKLKKGEKKVFYTFIRGDIDIFGLSINPNFILLPSITTYSKASDRVKDDMIHHSFILGIFFFMSIYTLILTVFLRDKVYWFFTFTLFFAFSFIAYFKGLSWDYLLPEYPDIDLLYFFPISASLYNIFFILFSQKFLDLRKYLPTWNKFISITMLIAIALILIRFSIFKIDISLSHTFGHIANLLFFIIDFILFVFALYLVRKSSVAIFYLLANSLSVVGSLTNIWLNSPIFVLGFNIGDIALVANILVFAYALVKRIQLIGKEKAQAQAETIKIQQEANQQLEAKVTERTLQLKETNEELHSTNDELHKKNEDITASITYAKRIQTAMLPRLDDIQKALPESFILFKPRDIVSGDFYYFKEISPTVATVAQPSPSGRESMEEEIDSPLLWGGGRGGAKIIIACADCTGHGVPGAFMSMIGNEILTNIVEIQGITSPDLILNELHKNIRAALKQGETENRDGMDIAIVTIEKEVVREDSDNGNDNSGSYVFISCCKSIICAFVIFTFLNVAYAQNDRLKPKYDTTYIKQYRKLLSITFIGHRRDFSVSITNPTSTNQTLLFMPRSQFSWGLGFDYKWFTLEFTSRMPPQKLSTNASQQGQLGIRLGITGQKIWFSGFYQRYRGMEGTFVNNDSASMSLIKNLNFLRQDISTTTFYTSLNYGFNYRKYSQMAALWQIDRQMKSAGSFVVGIAAFAYYMQADSTLVPSVLNTSFEKDSQVIKSTTQSIGINVGYAHTFVIKKKFFIHGSLIPCISYQRRKYAIIDEENLKVQGLSFSTEFRTIVGYNGEKWFGGMAYSNYSFTENSIIRGAGAVLSYDFLRFFAGFRFSPKVKIPFFD